MLAKGCLSRLYKIPEDEIIFARGEHSKPYVLNMNAHFNISHSGKYVVVAVSDVPIGADIEVVRDFSAILAKKTFNDDELAYISGRTPYRKKIEMQKAFYEIWTAKEAYLKYTGQGISGGINSLFFKYENSALVAQNKNIDLVFDYSVPGAVTAIVTQKRR